MANKEKTRKITLNSGLELDVDESAMNDMELLEALADLDDGNGYAIPRVCKLLLGEENKKKLYDSLRKGGNGRVPITSAVDALKEIMDKLGDSGKN